MWFFDLHKPIQRNLYPWRSGDNDSRDNADVRTESFLSYSLKKDSDKAGVSEGFAGILMGIGCIDLNKNVLC
jgi:hypothetical protein